MRLLAVSLILFATSATAQGGIDIRRTPTRPLSELGRPGQIDVAALPVETRLALLEKAAATSRQQVATLQKENEALRADLDAQKAALASNAKTTQDRFAAQDEKLGTIAQALGKVPPHSHGVIVNGPTIQCAFEASCDLKPNGGMLEGSTGPAVPLP